MNLRLKKFVGATIFVGFSLFYFFFVITVAIARLPGASLPTQLGFYFVATLIWFVVAAALIRWMQKPPSIQS